MNDALVKTDEGPQVLAMMSQAIAALGGANAKDGAEAMRVLFDLQREQADRHARREFFVALNEFHRSCPPIPRDHSTGGVEGGGGNKWSVKYAPLSTIERIVRPILIPLGFSWRWDTVDLQADKKVEATCYLMHVGGHEEKATQTVPVAGGGSMNAIQQYGAAAKYGMRYSMEKVLGLVTTDDDDRDGFEPGDIEPLDEDQLATVEHWLTKSGGDRAKFLKHIGASSTDAIQKRDFNRAVNALKDRANKAGQR